MASFSWPASVSERRPRFAGSTTTPPPSPSAASPSRRATSTKLKAEKSVKTKVPRAVPVHPVLAAMLADWRAGGWARLMGRPPRADDLIVPSRLGAHRSANHMLKKFHQDLGRLGLRTRRQHDLRRTFISLCLGDGASKDILRWITHAPEGDVVDDYTTLVWQPLCREVAKLQIANPATSHEHDLLRVTGRVTGGHPDRGNVPQVPGFAHELGGLLKMRGGRDLNPRPPA
jgi:hypothetical protein